MDLSAWMLTRSLPDEAEHFQALALAVERDPESAVARGELADYLRGLDKGAFARAVAGAPRARLTSTVLNWLAAGIEIVAARHRLQAPDWVRAVPPDEEPHFGSALAGVRLHLLTRAPVALRRRNLFFDSSFDDRV
jgi:hypothetical protein